MARPILPRSRFLEVLRAAAWLAAILPPLAAGCGSRESAALRASGAGEALSAVFTSPGRAASGASGGDVVRWDLAKREESGRLSGAAPGGARALAAAGNRLAVLGADGRCVVWDLAKRTAGANLGENHAAGSLVQMDAAGRFALIGGFEEPPGLYDAASGEELWRMDAGAMGFAIDPAGKRAAATLLNEVRIFDLATRTETARLPAHSDWALAVRFSPDGDRLASSGRDGAIKIWDLASAAAVKTIQIAKPALSLAWMADGKRILAQSGDGELAVWDAESGKRLRRFRRASPAFPPAVSPAGGVVLAAGRKGELLLWELEGEASESSPPPVEDGKTVAAVPESGDKAPGAGTGSPTPPMEPVESANPAPSTGPPPAAGKVGPSPEHAIEKPSTVPPGSKEPGGPGGPEGRGGESVTPDRAPPPDGGSTRTAPPADSSPILPEAAAPEPAKVAPKESEGFTIRAEGEVRSLAVSRDGLRLLSAEGEGVRLRSAGDGLLFRKLVGHKGAVNAVAFSPDGLRGISGGEDSVLRLWNLEDGKLLLPLEVPPGHRINALVFAPDGRRAVSAGADGAVRSWDLATGRELAAMTGHEGPVQALALAPDGRRLVSGGVDRTVRVRLLMTGRQVLEIPGEDPLGFVWGIAFPPGGRLAAAAGGDKRIRLLDLTTGKEAGRLEGHESVVRSVAVSAAGNWLASGGSDGTIIIMYLDDPKRPPVVLSGQDGAVLTLAVPPSGDRFFAGTAGGVLKSAPVPGGKKLPNQAAGDGR